MLIQEQRKWDIDFAQSYIIGDSNSDIEAGQRVNPSVSKTNISLLMAGFNISNLIPMKAFS